VQAFVDACQSRAYAIVAATVADLRVLGERCGAFSVFSELQAFPEGLPLVDRLLLAVHVCVGLESATDAVIAAVAEYFPEVIRRPGILDLDVSLIGAIVATARESGAAAGADASAVAEFAGAVFAKWGSVCPDFSRLLDVGSLARDSLSRLPAEVALADGVGQLEALKADLCARLGEGSDPGSGWWCGRSTVDGCDDPEAGEYRAPVAVVGGSRVSGAVLLCCTGAAVLRSVGCRRFAV
jgi:hypothetical protein